MHVHVHVCVYVYVRMYTCMYIHTIQLKGSHKHTQAVVGDESPMTLCLVNLLLYNNKLNCILMSLHTTCMAEIVFLIFKDFLFGTYVMQI